MKMYKDVKKYIMPFESERFSVEHFSLSNERVKLEKLKAMFNGSYEEVHSLKAGKYIKLIDKKQHQIIMSDTPMELETNKRFVEEARGSVLIAGLGLGIVLLAIQKKKEVKRILVCEKEMELIEKIVSQLPLNKKVEIIQADIFEFKPNEKFDVIYFDIWNDVCADNYEDMKLLHCTYKKYLNEGGCIDSWRKEKCKEFKYLENKENRMCARF